MNRQNAYRFLPFPLNNKWILLFLMIGLSLGAYSQQRDSLLSKPITINIKGATVYQALNQIGDLAGCFFIYDSKDVKSDKKIQPLEVINKPLVDILNQLLSDPTIDYKVIDKHILIFQDEENQTKPTVEGADSSGFITIGGIIYDKDTKIPIPFSTVVIEKIGLGTISNFEGLFYLRIPKKHSKANIIVSHLGYDNLSVPIEMLEGKTYKLYIQPRYIPIQEVFIRNIDAKGIIKSAIENKTKNYYSSNIYLTSFYREGVKRNNKYLGYSEAVFKIFKSSYQTGTEFDQVRLLKSRKIELSERSDTLIVKLKAGIKGAIDLDIVKSMPDFLDPEFMDNYIYTKTDIISHDSRSAYVISFEQKPNIYQPLFTGTIYVDVENLTILGADFGINPKYVEASANLFVLKKDRKISVKPENIWYSVKYRQWNGRYYIYHARGDLSFNVKKRRKLFSSTYTLFIEYVGVQIDTLNVERFTRRDVLRPNIIFSEENYTYDSEFWKDLNFISPEEDINKAISKINLKIESIENEQ